MSIQLLASDSQPGVSDSYRRGWEDCKRKMGHGRDAYLLVAALVIALAIILLAAAIYFQPT